MVGVERSADAVGMARAMIEERGLANVDVLCADGRDTGLPRESFDLATASLVLVNVFQAFARINDIDLFVAHRLPRLLREGGLVDVEARAVIHSYPPGHGRRTLALEFAHNLADRFVASDLVDPEELTRLRAELATHLAEPNTFVVSCVFVQAWGRKPA